MRLRSGPLTAELVHKVRTYGGSAYVSVSELGCWCAPRDWYSSHAGLGGRQMGPAGPTGPFASHVQSVCARRPRAGQTPPPRPLRLTCTRSNASSVSLRVGPGISGFGVCVCVPWGGGVREGATKHGLHQDRGPSASQMDGQLLCWGRNNNEGLVVKWNVVVREPLGPPRPCQGWI